MYRKYDIINLISTEDDHCWVGELNGLVGWFPAKFVEMIDERSKEYSQAGDDKVTQAITGNLKHTEYKIRNYQKFYIKITNLCCLHTPHFPT